MGAQPATREVERTDHAHVLNGNGTNEMHFVSPVGGTFDYHLADALSPAANTGSTGEVLNDVDGEVRPNGLPDVGADEFYP